MSVRPLRSRICRMGIGAVGSEEEAGIKVAFPAHNRIPGRPELADWTGQHPGCAVGQGGRAANEKSGPLRAALQVTLTGVFANSVLPLHG